MQADLILHCKKRYGIGEIIKGGCLNDLSAAQELVREKFASAKDRRKYLGCFERCARNVLMNNWPKVEALAAKLFGGRKLSYRSAAKIIKNS